MMKIASGLLLFCIALFVTPCFAQHVSLHVVPTNSTASFRGLSVVDNKVAWVSGTKGTIGISTSGGNDWTWTKVKGYEQCDFRSIYAFDEQHAVVANAGSPAYILITNDGGATWTEVYKNTDTAAFIDGLAFWDSKNGIVYGDPVGGRLMLLTTNDGGKSWAEVPEKSRPEMAKDEASFAASGTAMRCIGKSRCIIATGGIRSRLLISDNKGRDWTAISTPAIHGRSSTGVFSFACASNHRMIIVGGDYKQDTLCTDHVFVSGDDGAHWAAPKKATRGYRECVEIISDKTAIATGPSGTDISYDLGQNWQPLSDEKQFHVIRKSRKGNLIIMAGGGGRIAIVK